MSSKTIYKTCPICNTEFNAYSKWTKDKTYCSKSCVNKSRGSRSEETKNKISQRLIGIKHSSERIDDWKRAYNLKYPVSVCLVCGKECKHRGYKTCSRECYKHLCSIRPKKGRSHKGTFKGYNCDSLYELAFLIWHLDNNIDIKRSNNVYSYVYDNKISKYNPDFIVDGNEYEIKGYMCDRSKEKAKQHPHIKIIDHTLIKTYINYVKLKYKVKNLKELYE